MKKRTKKLLFLRSRKDPDHGPHRGRRFETKVFCFFSCNCPGGWRQSDFLYAIAVIGEIISKKGNHEGTKNTKECTKALLLRDSFVFFVPSWLTFFLGSVLPGQLPFLPYPKREGSYQRLRVRREWRYAAISFGCTVAPRTIWSKCRVSARMCSVEWNTKYVCPR